jgi:hypothetical protein
MVKLIHIVLILWDHYTVTVQEQAREMLVHLIHELIALPLCHDSLRISRQPRGHSSVLIPQSLRLIAGHLPGVPASMASVTRDVVKFFSFADEGVGDLWAKEALNWAVSSSAIVFERRASISASIRESNDVEIQRKIWNEIYGFCHP